MKEKSVEIEQDIKDLMFERLKKDYEYWGENKILEMLDFCNRNNLHSEKETLQKLLKPNRIK